MYRLKKSETYPDVWQVHRKLRKKIALAKWYAKKKKREIREEHIHRQQLEDQLQAEAAQRTYHWTDPLNRA